MNVHFVEMREPLVDAAGFLACRGVPRDDLSAARGDQFWDEPDHEEAAVLIHRVTESRSHAHALFTLSEAPGDHFFLSGSGGRALDSITGSLLRRVAAGRGIYTTIVAQTTTVVER